MILLHFLMFLWHYSRFLESILYVFIDIRFLQIIDYFSSSTIEKNIFLLAVNRSFTLYLIPIRYFNLLEADSYLFLISCWVPRGMSPNVNHILGQPLIQSKRERKNRRTFVPGVHFEFFVPDFGQNFEKKFGNAHPL